MADGVRDTDRVERRRGDKRPAGVGVDVPDAEAEAETEARGVEGPEAAGP